MHDEDQTFIPDSFLALYRDARRRLTATREHITQRYDLCEDMAHMMMEHCDTIHHRDGVDEAEVLRRCHRGLLAPPASVETAEAQWVVCRTAELLGWPFEPDSDLGLCGNSP